MSCLSVERRSSSQAAWLRKSLEAGNWPASRPPTRLRPGSPPNFRRYQGFRTVASTPETTAFPSLASSCLSDFRTGPEPRQAGRARFHRIRDAPRTSVESWARSANHYGAALIRSLFLTPWSAGDGSGWLAASCTAPVALHAEVFYGCRRRDRKHRMAGTAEKRFCRCSTAYPVRTPDLI
jgi:hypothetical protein